MRKLPSGTIGIIIEKRYLSGWRIEVDTFGSTKVSKATRLEGIETWDELIDTVHKFCDDIDKMEDMLIENFPDD